MTAISNFAKWPVTWKGASGVSRTKARRRGAVQRSRGLHFVQWSTRDPPFNFVAQVYAEPAAFRAPCGAVGRAGASLVFWGSFAEADIGRTLQDDL